jgi:hypothetical protein
MRRAIALAIVLAAGPALADLPRGVWRTARPIVLPSLSKAGPVWLPLDDEALAGVGALHEYRVVRDGRAEVPYKMVAETGKTETRECAAKVLSQGRQGDEQAQVTVDLGPSGLHANRIAWSLKGDNFRCKTRVEGSRDGGQWWVLVKDAVVYRHEGRFEELRVRLPANEYRFLRATLSKIEGKLPGVEGLAAYSEATTPRRLVQVPARVTRHSMDKQRQTQVNLYIGKATWGLAEAKFDIKEPLFDRTVLVEYWFAAGLAEPGYRHDRLGAEGALRRLAPGKAVVLPLASVPDGVTRLRFSILNGDDRPLTIRGVALWRVRQGLVFAADPRQKYELWYGWSKAQAPIYEIQRLPMTTPVDKLPEASLGPARKLPLKPPPPPPWSERHRAVFWMVFVGVIALLAAIIVRSMRGVGGATAGK